LRTLLLVVATFLLLGASAAPVSAIPAFARKYKVTCTLCHAPFPRLTAFGETFAGNGFEMAVGEEPRDTVDTGDPWLRLQNSLPLAIRFEAYAQGLISGSDVQETDLQGPYGVKLLSGGQVTDKISYYFYFYLSERGEVAGLEDAYVQFTDIGGTGVSAMVGQFQVSDPMFKRELRLEYEDYHLYRARIGEARADLTYDRGIMVPFSLWEGGDFVLQAVNGNGLSEAESDRVYDNDKLKNYGARFSQDLGGMLRVGVFGYYGEEKSDGLHDEILWWGPDLTLSVRNLELNLQYLRRTDSNPFFLLDCGDDDYRYDADASDPFEVTTDGAMAELLWFPKGETERWAVSALYNYVESDRQVLSMRLGEQEDEDIPFLKRYSYGALGASYLVSRNFRFLAEAGWNFDQDEYRGVLGFVAAF
jgi:hypothetical protein